MSVILKITLNVNSRNSSHTFSQVNLCAVQWGKCISNAIVTHLKLKSKYCFASGLKSVIIYRLYKIAANIMMYLGVRRTEWDETCKYSKNAE